MRRKEALVRRKEALVRRKEALVRRKEALVRRKEALARRKDQRRQHGTPTTPSPSHLACTTHKTLQWDLFTGLPLLALPPEALELLRALHQDLSAALLALLQLALGLHQALRPDRLVRHRALLLVPLVHLVHLQLVLGALTECPSRTLWRYAKHSTRVIWRFHRALRPSPFGAPPNAFGGTNDPFIATRFPPQHRKF